MEMDTSEEEEDKVEVKEKCKEEMSDKQEDDMNICGQSVQRNGLSCLMRHWRSSPGTSVAHGVTRVLL